MGLKFHSALEALDFKNLNIDILPVDDFIKSHIKAILKNPLFKNVKKAKCLKELEFYFEKDNQDYHGIIDLLCEYDDHFDLIDYKLSDLSKKEYERQLSIYKDYIASRSDKRIDLYLISLLKNEIVKINLE